MRKIVFLFLLSVTAKCTLAQKNTANSLQLSGGKSWHGTGDLSGILVDIAYEHSFTKRLDFSNGVTTTIHYGKDNSAGYVLGSATTGREFRFTTAGIQLTSMMHFAPLYFSGYKFRIDAGGIARFQSSSLPNVYGYYNQPNIFPEPFYVFNQREPQNIFSVGYTFGLSFIAPVARKYQAGIKALFQNDTNGDAITQISLIFGRFMNPSK